MRMLHANHHRLTLPPLDIGRRRTVQRGHAEAISLGKVQIAKRGLAEARRVRQHGLEHGLKLARRARDDAQDLRGRRLLLQRLGEMLLCIGEFAGPLVELFLEVGGGGTAMPRDR